jgi:hypothetical protein
MPELSVSTDWTYRGLSAIVLENRFLRAVILPELGAKLWQITYKPHDRDLLWNNPRIPPARLPMNSRYDDVWSGGWDELFPNDQEAVIQSEPYPDHGELWTGLWNAKPFTAPGEVGVKLRFETPISSIQFDKTIILRSGSRVLRFQHRLTNAGTTLFPFMWKLHPAFAVTPAHRLDYPPMDVELDPSFLGTLEGAPRNFRWPGFSNGDACLDLRCVPRSEERRLYFFYGLNFKQGWCGLTDTSTGLACGMHFDPAVFSVRVAVRHLRWLAQLLRRRPGTLYGLSPKF